MSAETMKTKIYSFKTKNVLKKIVLAGIILMVVSFVFNICSNMNSSSVSLKTYFSTATEGMNPDGSPFNIQEVLSDEVLNRASEKMGGKISSDNLRKHLSISYNTSAIDHDNLRGNIRKGNDEYMAVPTAYVITYSVVSEKIGEEGLFSVCKAFFGQLLMPGKNEILKAVSESYKEYYEEKYILSSSVLEVDWAKIDNLDYYNRAISLADASGRINRFMQEKYNANIDFVADNGMGYGELHSEISRIISNDLENYKSFVVQKGLTKDEDKLIRQFRFMEDKNLETNERQSAFYGIIKDAIDFYDSDVTRVVFIPALDHDDSFYMNRTKVGIDYLIESADAAKLSADEAEHSARNYQYLIRQFEKTSDASDEAYEKADAMYAEIKESINSFKEVAVPVMVEETEKESFVKIEAGNPSSEFGIVSLGISTMKLFVMLVIVAYLLMCMVGYLRKKKI